MPSLHLPSDQAPLTNANGRIQKDWFALLRDMLKVLNAGIINLFPSATTSGVVLTDSSGNPTAAGTLPLSNLPAHHTRHELGGSDAIKLDDLATPDDNTDLNASTTKHGLLRKLTGTITDLLRGDGSFARLNLASDPTGVLPVANGGTGITNISPIQTAIVNFNHSQILGMNTTPQPLVAAQGVNKLILPVRYWLLLTLGAVYTNIDPDGYLYVTYEGGDVASGYLGNDAGIPGFTQFGIFFSPGGPGSVFYELPFMWADDRGSANGWGLTGSVKGSAGNANLPLYLHVYNPAGDLTGGGVGDQLQVIVDYRVVTITP